MKDKIFIKIFTVVLALCLAFTIAHAVYAVYAYNHCSIIQFIAKELW